MSGAEISEEGKQGGGPRLAVVSLLSRTQAKVLRRWPWRSIAGALIFYALVILIFGDGLGISSNYFVILPVIVAALSLGLEGGLVAGLLGLPSNLLLFHLLGHPEFSPASKLIAEFSGIVVGFFFGALSDYFEEIEREMLRRRLVEEELRRTLGDREVLLRELNHRVRNNLGVVKGLVRLQRSRSEDPKFVAASDELVGRIFAIALVHEELDTGSGCLAVDLPRYVRALAVAASSRSKTAAPRLELGAAVLGRRLPVDAAVHLGLIVNEAVASVSSGPSRKEARQALLSLDYAERRYLLRLEGLPETLATEPAEDPVRFARRLMESLATGLGAELELRMDEEGPWAVLSLRFPDPMEEAGADQEASRESGLGTRPWPDPLEETGLGRASPRRGGRPVLPPNADRNPSGTLLPPVRRPSAKKSPDSDP